MKLFQGPISINKNPPIRQSICRRASRIPDVLFAICVALPGTAVRKELKFPIPSGCNLGQASTNRPVRQPQLLLRNKLFP
jgi:hypothetical protein